MVFFHISNCQPVRHPTLIEHGLSNISETTGQIGLKHKETP